MVLKYICLSLAYQVENRHKFLDRLITVKNEELTSYENMYTCMIIVTVCICVFSIMEVVSFFTYMNFVSNVSLIINHF